MLDPIFQKFLNEYYSNPDFTKWDRWIEKYVEPAYSISRHMEMVKNFGYVSLEKHDFNEQNRVYSALTNEKRLDEPTKKFIGFLAGTGFFKYCNISLIDWFNMANWNNPQVKVGNGKAINELLEYDKGLVCFKLDLLEMPFWKR